MSLYEAILKYESWKTYSVKLLTMRGHSYDLRQFCLFLRNPDLEAVNLEDVLLYLKYMRQLGWDDNSLVQKMRALTMFLRFNLDLGHRVMNPALIPKLYSEPRIARVMNQEHYDKLVGSIKTNLEDDLRNRLLLMMLWDTGARNGEILSLDIEKINLEKKSALIRTEKAKRERPFREILWTNTTNEVLKRWLELRGQTKGPLFITLSNNYYAEKKRLTTNGLSGLLRRLCDKAKIPRYNPHSFRHHMAHDILDKSGNIVQVAKVLGHSSAKSSLNYLDLNDKEMHEIYRRVKGE
jgi:site-specific recombinase XerD